jgi:Cu-Zn family superoxide dismutase
MIFSRHVGDLGNIEADSKGVAKVEIKDSLVKLSGEHSVIGRSIVVSLTRHIFLEQNQLPTDRGQKIAADISKFGGNFFVTIN